LLAVKVDLRREIDLDKSTAVHCARNEGMRRSGGITPHILNLGTAKR
jgi:hypothetical protein